MALYGDLGAGKTLFTRGLALGLESPDSVMSPTFNLMLEYRGRIKLRHLDAYFAEREKALLDEACAEVFGPDGAAVVEWAEKVAEYLPPQRLEIRFEHEGPASRRLKISGLGKEAKKRVAQFMDSAKDWGPQT